MEDGSVAKGQEGNRPLHRPGQSAGRSRASEGIGTYEEYNIVAYDLKR